jgi:hypothetical protein
MMTKRSVLRQQRGRAIALAVLLSATAAGCAQAPSDDPPSSGSSVPPGAGPVDYHSYPYNIQAGS